MGHARRETVTFRHRRAGDTARWRERVRCGEAVYPVEVDETTFQLMERFAGLYPGKATDRQAVAIALGRLVRLGLDALLREAPSQR
jgi:hypothetical protein